MFGKHFITVLFLEINSNLISSPRISNWWNMRFSLKSFPGILDAGLILDGEEITPPNHHGEHRLQHWTKPCTPWSHIVLGLYAPFDTPWNPSVQHPVFPGILLDYWNSSQRLQYCQRGVGTSCFTGQGKLLLYFHHFPKLSHSSIAQTFQWL